MTVRYLDPPLHEFIPTDPEDIRALADAVESVLSQKNFCVVGNEEKIREQKELFLSIEQLL